MEEEEEDEQDDVEAGLLSEAEDENNCSGIQLQRAVTDDYLITAEPEGIVDAKMPEPGRIGDEEAPRKDADKVSSPHAVVEQDRTVENMAMDIDALDQEELALLEQIALLKFLGVLSACVT